MEELFLAPTEKENFSIWCHIKIWFGTSWCKTMLLKSNQMQDHSSWNSKRLFINTSCSAIWFGTKNTSLVLVILLMSDQNRSINWNQVHHRILPNLSGPITYPVKFYVSQDALVSTESFYKKQKPLNTQTMHSFLHSKHLANMIFFVLAEQFHWK